MATSPNYNARVVKLVIERAFGIAGSALGGTALGGVLAPLLGGQGLLGEAVGIGGAAATQIPLELVTRAVRYTGGDAASIHRKLNEGADVGVQAFVKRVTEHKRKNPAYEPTDEDVEFAASEGMNALKDSMDLFRVGSHKVVVDAMQHVFHDTSCPFCYRSGGQSKKGQGGGGGGGYKEGCREVTVEWAVRNGYLATTASCCGTSATQTGQHFKKVPTSLLVALTELNQTLQQKYARFFRIADKEQRKRIVAAGKLDEYTPETLQLILEFSGNVDEFLAQLPEPPKPAETEDILGKITKVLKGPDDDDPDFQKAQERASERTKHYIKKARATRARRSAVRKLNDKK